MQLFSIGLVKLNIDGTTKLDNQGNPIITYDSQDIVSFARLWTGFQYGVLRGNHEELGLDVLSRLDPMYLEIDRRDWFPKRGLDGTWIGDRLPLCSDLPDKHFLRKGAKYRLLGRDLKSIWMWQPNPVPANPYDNRKWVHLPESSELYEELCNRDNDSNECVYHITHTLDTNLKCSGVECNVETFNIIKVKDFYYEYVQLPCVQTAFYEDAKRIVSQGNGGAHMCANPVVASAGASCCGLIELKKRAFYLDKPNDYDWVCEHFGEKINYVNHGKRCHALGGYPCEPNNLAYPDADGQCNAGHAQQDMPWASYWMWTVS